MNNNQSSSAGIGTAGLLCGIGFAVANAGHHAGWNTFLGGCWDILTWPYAAGVLLAHAALLS